MMYRPVLKKCFSICAWELNQLKECEVFKVKYQTEAYAANTARPRFDILP